MSEAEGQNLTINEAQRLMREFLDERGWFPTDTEGRYYTMIHATEEMGEVARCITHLESRRAEVQERRGDATATLEELEAELADVFFHVMKLAEAYGLNLNQAFLKKMVKNRAKYPLEKFKDMGF